MEKATGELLPPEKQMFQAGAYADTPTRPNADTFP